MKKAIISLLLIFCLMATTVLATTRWEDEDEPIENFRVFKRVCPQAENKVVVFTVNGGMKGTVVIDLVSKDDYKEALEIARGMLNTAPTEYSIAHGTPFAYVRAWI